MKYDTRGVSTKRYWRWASAIHAHRYTASAEFELVQLPLATWRRAESLLRKLHLASAQNWSLAARQLHRNLKAAVRELQNELKACERTLDSCEAGVRQASVADLFRDIVALHEEFDQVEFQFNSKTLSVVTGAIELEEVYLGPFQIKLDWSSASKERPHTYRVIACDPQPARSNGSVTHPHVQDESLCEGEGASSIHQALREGRLFDFFLVVANVLQTYNSGSPHVDLADWFEIPCSDCGSLRSDYDCWACTQCGVELCEECRRSCLTCAEVSCSDCIGRCPECEGDICHGCLTICAGCHEECCRECLTDEDRCKACHEMTMESEPILEGEHHANETTAEATRPDLTDAPVQSDRVGKTALLA